MEEYLISMGISTILMALKKYETKKKFRDAFLKIYRGIKTAFPHDQDFQ